MEWHLILQKFGFLRDLIFYRKLTSGTILWNINEITPNRKEIWFSCKLNFLQKTKKKTITAILIKLH